MKRINLKSLIILIVLIGALGIGSFGVYKFQRRRSVAALLVQARAAEKAGDRSKAEGLYAHYLGFRGDDTAALSDYASLLVSEADSPEDRVKALAVLQQLIRRDPSRSDARREAIRIGMDQTVKAYPQAFEQIEALLITSPDDGSLELQAGQCLEGERKYQEAADFYTKAVQHAPTLVEGYVRLAALLRSQLAKSTEADQVLDQMVELNPKSYQAYLERGNQRRLSGTEGAEQDIAHALELAPDEVDVLAAAADLAIGRGDIEEARKLADRCLKGGPKQAHFYDLAYRIELKDGHPDEAEAVLRKGLEAEPDEEGQIRLLISLSDLQILRENYAEAEKTIERLNSTKVISELPKYFTARVQAGKGQWREAAKLLDEVLPGLSNIPDMAYDANLILALCCERLGEGDRRYTAFTRAVALNPQAVTGRLGLAESLAASGRLEEAIAQYRSIENDVPQVRTALARLLLIRNLQRPTAQRDWTEVDKALAAAESATPGTLEVQFLRAEALADRGRIDESRKELKAAAASFPDQDSPWIAQAQLALKEGRPEVASAVLDEADRTFGDRLGLRLARADIWIARGGKEAVGALDRLAEGFDGLPEQDRPRLLLGLAQAHDRVGDLPGARSILDGLVKQFPDDLTLRLSSFNLAFRSGDADGMKSIIEAIGDKDDVAARLARARYLAWTASREGQKPEDVRNQLLEARQLLTQAAARRPAWAPVVLAKAYVEDLSGNQEGAIQGYRQAIDLGERGPEIVIRALQMLASRGRYDQADEVIRKVLGGDATIQEPKFYRLAAEVALRVKDIPRALDYGAKSVEAKTTNPADLLWRGRLLWAAGKTAQAEPDLRAAVASAGEAEAPEAWLSLVAYLAATDRRAQAEEAIEQARAKLPERSKALVLARCFANLNQTDKAREQYRAAVSSAPSDLVTLRGAADVALGVGEFEDAKDFLRKIVALPAKSPAEISQARRTLGVLLAASGDRRQVRESLGVMGLVEDSLPALPDSDESIDELRAKAQVLALRGGKQNRRVAIEALKTILGRQEPSPNDRFLLAQILEMDGDWSKSQEQLRLALADSGDTPAFLAFYIRGLLRHEEARGVKPWLDALVKADPSSLQTVELKARLALAEKQPEVASKLLGDFAQAHPDSTLQVALMLESLGRLADAERLFREASSREKKPEASLPLAVFLGRQKRVPEALEICDAAWKSGQPELVSQASVAVLYASMADPEACRRVAARLEEAIRRSPGIIQLQFDLANVQILLGKYQDAEVVFRRIYEKDKENASSANNLAWLLTMQDGKASEAITLVDQAISFAGPLPMLLDTRAMARMALGQFDAAIEDLEESTNSGPSATHYFHLAQAYLKAGRRDDAREALREANVLGLEEGSVHPIERKDYQLLIGELPPG